MLLAISCRDRAEFDQAVLYVHEWMDVFREDWPDEPERAQPWIVLGEIEAGRKQYKDAIAAFERGLAIAPGHLFGRLELSRAARMGGEFALAETSARRVVGDAPDFALAHAALGEALLMTQGANEARREFEIARRLDPRVPIDADALRRVGLPVH
jgi:tetratricopeptide (TPR) repeat protein